MLGGSIVRTSTTGMPALDERRRLSAADQAAAEDDRDVRVGVVGVVERARPHLDVEAVLLEQVGEVGLPRGHDEYLSARPRSRWE